MEENDLIVAAIGGSAGGLQAITELLENLPANTGIAYVYIQHLDPLHESNLAKILARKSKMPVLEVTNSMKISADHVYVIPPNKEMIIADHHLSISPRPALPYSNMPINRFFISLAELYKDAAIGIVLSGMATDGTIGLKAIKIGGGVTFAQDASAEFQSMPRSAISEGAVDFVLSPKEIANELVTFRSFKKVFPSLDEKEIELPGTDDEALNEVLQILKENVEVDFTQYKPTTIKRRILRRMMLYKMHHLSEYLQYFRKNSSEIKLLFQDLLINVTSFFRDADCTAYLVKEIIPRIIKSKAPAESLRVWVPACSTGQEAYSLAILLLEALGTDFSSMPIQIFATDLSESAINIARHGFYKTEEVAEVSPTRLKRYFTRTEGGFRVVKHVRDLCIFATHNIAKDPPFSRIDIISCCNLLIYLDVNLQRKIISTFHYSLNPNGYLVLGKSETVSSSAYLFNALDKKLKVYSKKKDMSVNPVFEMNYRNPEGGTNIGNKPMFVHKNFIEDNNLETIADTLLLKKYTPASVVVNKDLDILHFRGSTGLYLEASPGKASLNLMKMARPGLAFELRNIVHKTKQSGIATRKEGLDTTIDGKVHRVAIEALPLKTAAEEDYYLVIFEEMTPPVLEEELVSSNDRRVKLLEEELTLVREDMRSIIEMQQSANEELQSANEEIVSSNEELQSINEELETSKEEIESSNEELITINQELQVRNEELAEAQEYSDFIYGMIRESVLVLDKDYRIKSANRAFYETFKLKEQDVVDRFLNELSDQQWNSPVLRRLMTDIIQNGAEFRDFEINDSFPGVGQKSLLVNGKKVVQNNQTKHLFLLAIEDITSLRSQH